MDLPRNTPLPTFSSGQSSSACRPSAPPETVPSPRGPRFSGGSRGGFPPSAVPPSSTCGSRPGAVLPPGRSAATRSRCCHRCSWPKWRDVAARPSRPGAARPVSLRARPSTPGSGTVRRSRAATLDRSSTSNPRRRALRRLFRHSLPVWLPKTVTVLFPTNVERQSRGRGIATSPDAFTTLKWPANSDDRVGR
jgi:hypothetical protein